MIEGEEFSVLKYVEKKNKSYDELKTHQTIFPDYNTKLLLGIIVYVLIIVLGLFGFFFLEIATLKTRAKITILFWFCILVIPWAIFSGWIWTKTGNFLFNFFLISKIQMLNKTSGELSTIQSIYALLIGGQPSQLFLQLESQDTDISNLQNLVQTTIRTLFVFLAILFISLHYISDPMVVFFSQYLTSIEIIYVLTFLINYSIAMAVLSVYHPFFSLLSDCRLMTLSDDGSISYVYSKPMNLIGGIFGITGIISGINVINIRIHDFEGTIIQYPKFVIYSFIVLIYVIILVCTIVMTLPILLPAFYLFYKGYSEDINKIREILIEMNIPIGYTMINTNRWGL